MRFFFSLTRQFIHLSEMNNGLSFWDRFVFGEGWRHFCRIYDNGSITNCCHANMTVRKLCC